MIDGMRCTAELSRTGEVWLVGGGGRSSGLTGSLVVGDDSIEEYVEVGLCVFSVTKKKGGEGGIYTQV
jgi:hypothetical protein